MSPRAMTATELAGEIQSAIEQFTGMKASEFAEWRKATDEAKKAGDAVRREHTADLVAHSMPAPYAKSAASMIRRDRHKGVGFRMGAFLRAFAASKQENRTVEDQAKSWDMGWMADDISQARAQAKSLTANALSAGGAIVPNEYVDEIIELLRAQAVVRDCGCVEMPLKTGTMTLPRQSAAATATYVGEALNITSSQPAFEQIQLLQRKLASVVPVSNDLIRQSDPAADQIVRDDLVRVMALREDLAFIRGDGTSNTPKGLLNRASSSNQFARTQASPPQSTLSEITNDLFTSLQNLLGANVPIVRPAWLMASRTAIGLRRLRDSLGNLVFDPEMRNGTLMGFPYRISNQIPINLGSGTNKSEVYFFEATQAIIADTLSMELTVVPNGAYFDGTAVQSGISQDLTVIRAISAHDFALRHDKVASVINTVDWGT